MMESRTYYNKRDRIVEEMLIETRAIKQARENLASALEAPAKYAPSARRELIERFLDHILLTIDNASRYNVKQSTNFIVTYIAASPYRLRWLSRYLLELSKSLKPGSKPIRNASSQTSDGKIRPAQDRYKPPPASWRRYNVLCIIYDVLDKVYDIDLWERIVKGIGWEAFSNQQYPERDCHIAYDVHDARAGPQDIRIHHKAFEKYITDHVTDWAALAAVPDPPPRILTLATKLERTRTAPSILRLMQKFKNRLIIVPEFDTSRDEHDIKGGLFGFEKQVGEKGPVADMEDRIEVADKQGDFAATVTQVENHQAEIKLATHQAATAAISTDDGHDSELDEEKLAYEHIHKKPRRHGMPGNPHAEWHELPAANGLMMKRLRGYPLQARAMPAGGYELPFKTEGEMDEINKKVDRLILDVKGAHEKWTNADEVKDVNALGDIIWKDPERKTRNYWGWSYEGIEKRKANAEKFKESAFGYADLGPLPPSRAQEDAVARARALAAGSDPGGGYGRGGPRGDGRGGRGGRGHGGRGGRDDRGRGRSGPVQYRGGERW